MRKKVQATCPHCGFGVAYRYGTTVRGKSRCLCLGCSRQFTIGAARKVNVPGRPACPKCGGRMHLYRSEKNGRRFRCASYPECRTYLMQYG